MRSIVVFAATAALAMAALAQSEQDHAAHHPDGAPASAAGVKKAPAQDKQPAAKAGRAAPAASAGMGMGMGGDMQQMHREAHKPGGMHDKMHGKEGKMKEGRMEGGPMSAMPSASAASRP